jgi:ech hydrogenase subunit D
MSKEKPQIFIDITYEELRGKVGEYNAGGWRFVNICGNTVTGGVELIYSFSKSLPLENLRFVIDNDTEISSISDCFPNAFLFENETHDLFGVRFSNISIDFGGEFYTVAVPTPMNPHSRDACKAAVANISDAANCRVSATPREADAKQASAGVSSLPSAQKEGK